MIPCMMPSFKKHAAITKLATNCFSRKWVSFQTFSLKAAGGLDDFDRKCIEETYYNANSIFEFGIGQSTDILRPQPIYLAMWVWTPPAKGSRWFEIKHLTDFDSSLPMSAKLELGGIQSKRWAIKHWGRGTQHQKIDIGLSNCSPFFWGRSPLMFTWSMENGEWHVS